MLTFRRVVTLRINFCFLWMNQGFPSFVSLWGISINVITFIFMKNQTFKKITIIMSSVKGFLVILNLRMLIICFWREFLYVKYKGKHTKLESNQFCVMIITIRTIAFREILPEDTWETMKVILGLAYQWLGKRVWEM